jgi:predicted PurR-regulated permease PerM
MDRQGLFHYVLIAILLGLLLLAFLLLRPFLTYLALGLIIAYMLHPVYRFVRRVVRYETVASILMLLLVMALIIVPAAYLITSLVQESMGAYTSLQGLNISVVPDHFVAWSGMTPESAVEQGMAAVKNYFVDAAPNLLGSIASIALGIVIMFAVMFFAFRDGERWVTELREWLPLEPKHKSRLFERIGSVTRGVVYGQILTALVQGFVGGLLFYIFKLPNPVFWGSMMVILSFIPVVGTALVWVPAGISLLAQQQYVAGLGVLLGGAIIVSNIDNLIRPFLIGMEANVSVLLVFLGVLGGLKLFGLVGLVIGPLILVLLQTVAVFFHEQSEHAKKT